MVNPVTVRGLAGPVEQTPIVEAKDQMETNFWGPVRTIQAALPAMRAKGGAVIINVSSVSGSMPGTPYSSWYSASKHALNALTEALYIELDGIDVRVACVDPGFFKTEMVENSRARGRAAPSDPYQADQAWLVDFFQKSVEAVGGVRKTENVRVAISREVVGSFCRTRDPGRGRAARPPRQRIRNCGTH